MDEKGVLPPVKTLKPAEMVAEKKGNLQWY
jgi:hypothetical protein